MPKEQREVPLRKVPYEDINSAKKVVGESKNTKKKKTDRTKEDIAIEKKLGLPKRSDGSHLPKQYREVVEDAKMGRQSDEKLSSLQKQFSGMDQSTPSNQHMLKRVNREINKRKKQNSVEEEVTNEAKVDDKLSPQRKETARNKRRYGNWPVGQHAQTSIRRSLGWADRGEKKRRGAKVEEEVGLSSSAAMKAAHNEAKLRKKEEAAVKKAKKAKKVSKVPDPWNEEVALENRMASHTAGMSDAQKDSASNTISKGAAYKMGRRTDAAAFGDRKKSGKRGNPQQYRKSADSPEWEGRFPYGKSNIRQGKGSIKDLKNEYSPAVEKVIESIKINKASPKSPNCIIMPKKDDITDKAGGNGKKSTKNVVSKKQKQFFNQEGKTYSSFLKEYLSTLTKAAAGQAAKGAITTTAKTVGKETVKQGVKQGTGTVAANAIKTTAGKSLGKGQLAKTTSSAITKAAPKTTAITKVSPKAIEKVKPKVSTLAKSGAKQTAIQTATQTAVDKVGNKKPPTTGEKGGELAKKEPQKQGKPSKGIDIKFRKPSDHVGKVGSIKNPQ